LHLRRPQIWLLGTVALVLALGGGYVLHQHRSRSLATAGVLSSAPADSWLVVTVDLAAGAPLVRSIVDSKGGVAGATRVAGLGPIEEACGFEPLEHLRELLIAAPEGGDRGEFGVAFSADLGADALASCAKKAIAARGGKPAVGARGSFAVVSDGDKPDQGRLAVRPGGPFLVGRGAWLDAMIDAADGKTARIGPEHESLRRALAPPGAAPPVLLASALLPKALRDHVRSDGDGGAGAFEGVLSVGQAAAAVTVQDSPAAATQPTGRTEIDVELRCDPPDGAESCDQVKQLIERRRLAFSKDFGAHLTGFGPLIDTLVVTSGTSGTSGSAAPAVPPAEAPGVPPAEASGVPPAEGNGTGALRGALSGALYVKAHIPTADLARLLTRLLDLFERPPPPPASSPSPSPSPSP
jgi:hypothetical protein